MINVKCGFWLLILALLPAAAIGQPSNDYKDPDGLFTIHLPDGFKALRQRADIGIQTVITKDGDPLAPVPRIEFQTLTGGADINPAKLDTMAADLMDVFISELADDGQAARQKPSSVKLAGHDAVRCDIEFTATKGGQPQAGYLLVTMHQKTAILIAVFAPKADAEAMKLLEAAIATLTIGK